MRQYLDFCLAHNLASKENLLPAPMEENLVYFVASLQGNVQYRTVKLYLAAIANFYVEQGMPLRTDNTFQLHHILKGIKRTSTSQQRTRRPITIQILSEISDLLRPAFSEELDTIMLWPAFTFAFFGFLRVSEFTCSSSKSFLAVKDVVLVPNIQNPDHIKVRIKQSKTDPFREGTTLTILKPTSLMHQQSSTVKAYAKLNQTHSGFDLCCDITIKQTSTHPSNKRKTKKKYMYIYHYKKKISEIFTSPYCHVDETNQRKFIFLNLSHYGNVVVQFHYHNCYENEIDFQGNM